MVKASRPKSLPHTSPSTKKARVLIINGFDRISSPAVINTPDEAGFDLTKDPGVPYLYDISLCGSQLNFDRKEAGKRLGESGNEYEGIKIAGNTFDYPFIHGKAIQAIGGYSFTSCSDEAVENGSVALEEYPIADYILGLEKDGRQSVTGNLLQNFLFVHAACLDSLLPVGRQPTGQRCIHRQRHKRLARQSGNSPKTS